MVPQLPGLCQQRWVFSIKGLCIRQLWQLCKYLDAHCRLPQQQQATGWRWIGYHATQQVNIGMGCRFCMCTCSCYVNTAVRHLLAAAQVSVISLFAGTFWARRALVLSAVCYAVFLYLFWRLGRNLNLPGPTLSIGQVGKETSAKSSSS